MEVPATWACFDKIKAGLKKTRDSITGQINSMLHAFTKDR